MLDTTEDRFRYHPSSMAYLPQRKRNPYLIGYVCVVLLCVLPVNVAFLVVGLVVNNDCSTGDHFISLADWIVYCALIAGAGPVIVAPMFGSRLVIAVIFMLLSFVYQLVLCGWLILGIGVLFTWSQGCDASALWICGVTLWTLSILGLAANGGWCCVASVTFSRAHRHRDVYEPLLIE